MEAPSSHQQNPQSNSSQKTRIIPVPLYAEIADGHFSLAATTHIVASNGEDGIAGYLSERIVACTGLSLAIVEPSQSSNLDSVIRLEIVDVLDDLGPEGYVLEIDTSAISIRAIQPAGLFYGIQSLLQLFDWNDQNFAIPCLRIKDHPRFQWRALMLDTSRYYMPVDFIKKFIDLLAFHKMNVFHWHLVDDQGWRIEIKKYPELTEQGSIRKESPKVGARNEGDGTPYGPFWYSQDEVREVVAYAQERFITIVPEIEMPGHCTAALSVFPHLSCVEGPFDVQTRWGIFKNVYCAGNDAVFSFLQDVFDEILELFPSEYIHVGGDECPKDHWKVCDKCQERIRREGLKNEDELQSYFIRRIEQFLSSRGRKLIGWDEILEGGLSANSTVMSWRGELGGIDAAKAGNNVIMCPHNNCYLDYYQSLDRAQEPEAIGSYLPLHFVYDSNPVPSTLDAVEAKHIIGVQANIWTEYMQDSKHVEYMAFPRACAVAEVAWSQAHLRNYPQFVERFNFHEKRLKALEVAYRPLGDPFSNELKRWSLGKSDHGCIHEDLDAKGHISEVGRYQVLVRKVASERKFKALAVKVLCQNCIIAEMNLVDGEGGILDVQTFSFELEQSISDGFIRVQFEAELPGKDEAIVAICISKI